MPHDNHQAPQAGRARDAAEPQAADAVDEEAQVVRDLEDRLLRAVADADNLRKRHARELRQQREAERGRLTAAWLPVVDNLERALSHADADRDALLAGVLAVRDQAVHLLAQLGYPRDDQTGVPFDPARHEVVTMVDDPEQPPNTVVDVLVPGYGEPEHQLRPAAVAVNRPRE
ncbi:MAG TPA: nucleotide exchange factor GrpE [Pseudonocardiaceae bacterium]|jgi:molecular chaperone GrpE